MSGDTNFYNLINKLENYFYYENCCLYNFFFFNSLKNWAICIFKNT